MIVVHTYEIRPSMVAAESWNKGLEYVPRDTEPLFDIRDFFTKESIDYNCGGTMSYRCQSMPNLTWIPKTGVGYGYLEYIFK